MDDLRTFLVVARERSFTKAAAKLRLSQSRLSQNVRNLEEQLGVRLLHRTTRVVTPTAAGAHLLRTVAPLFENIQSELDALHVYGAQPVGTIKISATEYAAAAVLWPALLKVLPFNSGINVEVIVDYARTDIVAEGIDAGICPGDMVARGMIAMPIGPDMRMNVVAAPGYFEKRDRPRTPHDLLDHNCINLRLPSHGGLYAWEFSRDGEDLRIPVNGQVIVSTATASLTAALAGLGISYLPEEVVRQDVISGNLVKILDEWCEPFLGYHLYYSSRRQKSAAFCLLIEALKHSC